MEAVKEKVTEKILLYTDESELKNAKVRANKAEKELNSFISALEMEMGRSLNKNERLEALSDVYGFLEQSLTFPLPNAPEKLKYESVGVNLERIRSLYKPKDWSYYEFMQDVSGGFILVETQKSYEACKKYATPAKLKVLNDTKALAESLNTALAQGLLTLLNGGNPHKVREVFKSVSYNETARAFEPNMNIIAHLRE